MFKNSYLMCTFALSLPVCYIYSSPIYAILSGTYNTTVSFKCPILERTLSHSTRFLYNCNTFENTCGCRHMKVNMFIPPIYTMPASLKLTALDGHSTELGRSITINCSWNIHILVPFRPSVLLLNNSNYPPEQPHDLPHLYHTVSLASSSNREHLVYGRSIDTAAPAFDYKHL